MNENIIEKQRDLVEFIVKALVDYRDEVKVDYEEEEETCIIKIHADDKDYGKIIGKRGRIINAIHTLISTNSGDFEKKWVIDVLSEQNRDSKAKSS